MKTRFVYLGGTTIEIVVDGESIEVNMLPPAEEATATGPPSLRCSPGEVVAVALNEPSPAPDPSQLEVDTTLAAAPYSKKRRTLMGTIRASWFIIFTGVGEALTYALNNLTDLNLPPGTATLTGAVLAGTKRALWPDTIL